MGGKEWEASWEELGLCGTETPSSDGKLEEGMSSCLSLLI